MPYKDPEKEKLRRRQYYQTHKEKCLRLSKEWYKRHPEKVKEYIRRRKQRMKEDPQYRALWLLKQREAYEAHLVSLGPILCPKCGERGTLTASARINRRTGKFKGPYFQIQHRPEKALLSAFNPQCSAIIYPKKPKHLCNLGRLTQDELDTLVKRRPWAVTAEDAMKYILSKFGHP